MYSRLRLEHTLAQVYNLCLVLKKQSLFLFCSNEQHTDYKSARAWGVIGWKCDICPVKWDTQLKQGIKLFGWVYIGVMGKCRKKEDQTYLKLICILL